MFAQVRGLMATLGFTKMDDLIGRVDLLRMRQESDCPHPQTRALLCCTRARAHALTHARAHAHTLRHACAHDTHTRIRAPCGSDAPRRSASPLAAAGRGQREGAHARPCRHARARRGPATWSGRAPSSRAGPRAGYRRASFPSHAPLSGRSHLAADRRPNGRRWLRGTRGLSLRRCGRGLSAVCRWVCREGPRQHADREGSGGPRPRFPPEHTPAT